MSVLEFSLWGKGIRSEKVTEEKKKKTPFFGVRKATEAALESLGSGGSDVDVLDFLEKAARVVESEPEEEPFKEGKAESEDSFTYSQLTGPQGSNEGGWFLEEETGKEFYIKFYENESRAYTELIACKIYQHLGVTVPEVKCKVIDGKVAILSQKIEGAKRMSPYEMSQHQDVLRAFVADALLANWDSVGSAYDNIVSSPDGKAYRIDNGGALIYRARGARKQFSGSEFIELQSMRDARFPAGRVFSDITDSELKGMVKELLAKLDMDEITEIANSTSLDKELVEEIVTGLSERVSYLKKYVGSETTSEVDLKLEQIGNPQIVERWDKSVYVRMLSARINRLGYNGEKELKRGEGILIKVPDVLSGKDLDSVTLRHRKPERYRNTDRGEYDPEGAYSEVYVFDGDRWYRKGSKKYAEHRPASNPEEEVFHDWIERGDIKPKYIMVVGAGEGENGVVAVQGVDIEVHPEKSDSQVEMVFTPGTSFVDLSSGRRSPRYGGGMHPNMGFYPNAIPLNCRDVEKVRGKFPVTLEGENLHLEMSGRSTGKLEYTVGKEIDLQRVEVAIGDTEDWDGEEYKPGERFRRGWAKLRVYAKTSHGAVQIIRSANVPPRGVLKGSPDTKTLLKPGDKVVIESLGDTSYVMGIRLQ